MSRLDHSEIKVGTKYEFTTYGCPNVTITRYNIIDSNDGGSRRDYATGTDVASGEGDLQSNNMKWIATPSGKVIYTGYKASLRNMSGDISTDYEYDVTVEYIQDGTDRRGDPKYKDNETLAANKCFTKYVERMAVSPSYPSSSNASSASSGILGNPSSSASYAPPGGWGNSSSSGSSSFYPGGRAASYAPSSSSSSAAAPAPAEEEEENPKQSSSSAAAPPPKAPEDEDPSRRRRGGRRRRTHRRNMRKRSTRRRR